MSDEEILDELYSIYSNSAVVMYVSMLRNGCEGSQCQAVVRVDGAPHRTCV